MWYHIVLKFEQGREGSYKQENEGYLCGKRDPEPLQVHHGGKYIGGKGQDR